MAATFGMKRLLLLLAPWMVATAAFGQSRTAQAIYGSMPPLSDSVYRVADECYVPVFAVEAWGWKVSPAKDVATLRIDDATLDVPIRTVSNAQVIPLRAALDRLGADSKWRDDTLVVRNVIELVEIDAARILVKGSLPIVPHLSTQAEPVRLVVDLRGAILKKDAKVTLTETASLRPIGDDGMRITLDTADAAQLAGEKYAAARSLSVVLDPKAISRTTHPVEPPPGDSEPNHPIPIDPASAPPTIEEISAAPVLPQLNVYVDIESDRALLIEIRDLGELTGPVLFRKPEPAVLEVVLPSAMVQLPPDFKLKTSSITATELIQENENLVLRLTLARPMGAEVTETATGISIQLFKPKVGNGKLAGKVVVVDAGHGGHDSGARSSKTYEKNLTLAIAKLVAKSLAEAGATVLMTRKTDVYVPLLERADIANRNTADFFVSVHINSNTVANSRSGGITFYHKGSTSGRLLAECIQSEIAKVSKLRNLGAWSDGKIYQNGFSVLRNTKMPGVLLELGFINHSGDRKRLITNDFHKSIALAVVKGIKVYLGDAGS